MTSSVSYSLRIKASAAKELSRVERSDRERITDAIDRLREHPLVGAPLKGGMRGLRRIRVGDYRVLYEVQHDILVILAVRIAHRSDAYRRS